MTFDVDMTDYSQLENSFHFDEMDAAFHLIQSSLEKFPDMKTTWFVRIDRQIEMLYGSALYIFEKHREKLDWLRDNGHALGWHHHCYRQYEGEWAQERDEAINLRDVEYYGEIARGMGLKTSRMGWGYMTNNTIEALEKLGFCIDSSAIPRPVYPWEERLKDWSTTPKAPYYPGCNDYRVPDSHGVARSILELPMSVARIPAPADTVEMVRYINPAYSYKVFDGALQQLEGMDASVFIMHPYEILLNIDSHPLFCEEGGSCFESNLQLCVEKYGSSMTMDQYQIQ